MASRQELENIVFSEHTTAEQKQQAQVALNALTNSASAKKVPHYMDWIPDGSPEFEAGIRNLIAEMRDKMLGGQHDYTD